MKSAYCLRTMLIALVLALSALAGGTARSLPSPVTVQLLDEAAFAESVDGREKPIQPGEPKNNARLPQWVVYTDKTAPGHSGLKFGDSQRPGPRHLRVGFKAAVPVGAVLVRGGGRLSVLRSDVRYPGDLADDGQWLPAQRIFQGRVSGQEVGDEDCALWALPAKLKTRALRFTHHAEITDKTYAGYLGGAYVLAERMTNLAPQASAVAGANDKNAVKLITEIKAHPWWDGWRNIELKEGDRFEPVSRQHPEWLLLVWHSEVKLRGLGALFAGFGSAEAQAYVGPADVHPREAPENAWKSLKSFSGLKNRYPSALAVDWLDFGTEVTTRALRLRITAPMPEGSHPHVQGHSRGGKRVWLGKLFALHAVSAADLKNAILPPAAARERAPIDVKFVMPENGWVTLVIEDLAGKRVRNLVADTFFLKGEPTVGWDGSDDLGRDVAAARHGVYAIPTQLVQPGEFRVRGLWRKQVHVKYEMGVYNAGNPPWETADKTGGWLANHSPPSAVLFVPDVPGKGPSVLIGSYVSEGTAGLAWVDLDGRRWKGQNWVGGIWTGAPYLVRDGGLKRVADHYAYAAAAWTVAKFNKKKPKYEIRITALTAKEDRLIVQYPFSPAPSTNTSVQIEAQIGGLAVHDGLLAVSLTGLNRVLVVDARSGTVVDQLPLPAPRGLAFDREGRLLALSAQTLLRFPPGWGKARKLTSADVLLSEPKLQEPHGITLDADNNVYISEQGSSHQVKVFSPDGKLLRALGKAGPPQAGPYDPLHFNHPRGLTIDSRGRLWVAEQDYQPKRVSVWNADSTLALAFYGPAEYAGGGTVDSRDRTKFYYHGMEFKLDWTKGTNELQRVYYRPRKDQLPLAFRSGYPESAVYVDGRRYFHNSFNSNPTNGHGTAFIFADRNGLAVPVAACGRAADWEVLRGEGFKPLWPAGTFPSGARPEAKPAFFVWSDRNDDGTVQPDEVTIVASASGGITVMRDLSFVAARFEGKAVRWPVQRFTPRGTPLYDLAKREIMAPGAQGPPSSGGDQVLAGPDGWSIHTTAPKPFSAFGIGGSKNGVSLWTYPSLWPGLHASHSAAVPDRPAMVIGHTRLLGDFINPTGKEPMWLLNSNHGPIYVFTADGLFVAQLFQDMRLGKQWQMPRAERGMVVDDLTPSDENFWPSVTQTADGHIYLATGRPNALVRVEGLESVRRLPASDLKVSADDLNRCREYFVRVEIARQAAQGKGALTVALRKTAPKVDGNLDDWLTADWVDIDKRGARAYFNADTRPYDVTGAIAVAQGKLYAAWRTGDAKLLDNSGDVPNALFKTGGCLDLMIGVDPDADPKRTQPVPGDMRLLITRVAGKTRALLYQAVVPGKAQPVPFSSPGRTITFERVDDVSAQVELAASADGNFEMAIPLAVLALKPAPGLTLRGDIGILRGGGGVTIQRVYWSNKATAIVADVPSEAELRPNLWGRLHFVFVEGSK